MALKGEVVYKRGGRGELIYSGEGLLVKGAIEKKIKTWLHDRGGEETD